MWSWVLHRVAGVGTLVFVIMHVIDTSWATFYPELYARAIEAYATPIFTVGEFALVACVVYHALNGYRVAILDFRPQWWRHQALAARLVLLGTLLLLIPAFIIMFGHVLNYYNVRLPSEGRGFDLELPLLVEAVTPFAVGTVAVLAAAAVVAAVAAVLPGFNRPEATRVLKRSRLDRFMWTHMRTSGILILPLVFGHLAMVHLIQGVFDISLAGHIPVGTNLGANLAAAELAAPNFVAMRWNTMVAGVFVWRLYDILLLVLIVVHGIWGARYIVNDYARQRLVNRTLKIALLVTAVILLVVGALAIINTVPATVESFASEAQTGQLLSEGSGTEAR
jgi:succinate dehydrogenase / fumarate reductase cytochrome b subunit